MLLKKFLSVTLFILVMVNFLSLGWGMQTAQNPSPEVWLHSFSLSKFDPEKPASEDFRYSQQFKNKNIEKNRTDYVIDDSKWTTFVCAAPYPVEWITPNMTQVSEVVPLFVHTLSERLSEFHNLTYKFPQNTLFKSYLRFRLEKIFFSVTFTCRSAHAAKEDLSQSTIHIYNRANPVLENAGRNISVNYDTGNKAKHRPFTLPCRPGQPGGIVTAEKKFGEEWNPVAPKLFSFDPKLGFTYIPSLAPTPNITSATGLYRCTVSGNVTAKNPKSLIINVTSSTGIGSSVEKEHVQFRSLIKGRTKVEIGKDLFICCSGNLTQTPRLYHETCNGRFGCELSRQISYPKFRYQNQQGWETVYRVPDANRSDCVEIYLRPYYPTPVLVGCYGHDIDYFGELLMTFHKSAGNISWREEDPNKKSTSGKSLTIFRDLGKGSNVALDERMVILVGHNATGKRWGDWAVFSGNLNSYDSTIMNKEAHHPNKMLEMAEYGRNTYTVREPLRFMCFGLRYFHSSGAVLKLNWKNGRKLILKEDKNGFPRKVYFYSYSDTINSIGGATLISFFGEEVKSDLEMESVDCFMPHINGTGWDKLSYPIKVLQKN